ncbi:hypothetical protein ACFQ60_07105 [Streptomyces zhihengii]
MGATALSKQARQELAVMGVRVRETARTGISGLTPGNTGSASWRPRASATRRSPTCSS